MRHIVISDDNYGCSSKRDSTRVCNLVLLPIGHFYEEWDTLAHSRFNLIPCHSNLCYRKMPSISRGRLNSPRLFAVPCLDLRAARRIFPSLNRSLPGEK
jgi:hypothetical protein